MRLIKKYANRKLYDISDKRYLTMDRLADLIKSGEEVSIIDNETGEDITAAIVSQLLGREKWRGDKGVPSNVLMQLLRKGQGTLFGYGRKYISLWQNALLMSRDEIEKLINSLVREKEISESEGRNLKQELLNYTTNLKSWIMENIDQRVNEAMSMMNLASKEQVDSLSERIDALDRKVAELEAKIKADQKNLS